MAKLTPQKLDEMRNRKGRARRDWIRVGLSTCGIAAGAAEVYERLRAEKEKRGIEIDIERCGCAGQCYAEPLVEVCVEGTPRVVYGRIGAEQVLEILDTHVLGKRLLNDAIYQVKAD